MRRIAPNAAGIAYCQSHKYTGQPLIGRFALQAAVNLMDQQLARRLVAKSASRRGFEEAAGIRKETPNQLQFDARSTSSRLSPSWRRREGGPINWAKLRRKNGLAQTRPSRYKLPHVRNSVGSSGSRRARMSVRKRILVGLVSAATAACWTSAALAQPGAPPANIVATVNGSPITMAEVELVLKKAGPKATAQRKPNARKCNRKRSPC